MFFFFSDQLKYDVLILEGKVYIFVVVVVFQPYILFQDLNM